MENPMNPPPNPNVNQLWLSLVIVNVRNNFSLYYWARCFCTSFRNVNHWAWILNLLSLGFSFHLNVRILIWMVKAIKEKDDKLLIALGVPLSFLLAFVGYLWDTYCYVHLMIAISNRISSRGWSRKFPRWLIFNFTMNLWVLLTRIDTLSQMFWASTASVSLVATIALAHNRRDQTGITEGFGVCFIICGLINIHAHSKDNDTNAIAILSFFTAALCFICAVAPNEAIVDPEDKVEKLKIKIEKLQLVILRFRSSSSSRAPPADVIQQLEEL